MPKEWQLSFYLSPYLLSFLVRSLLFHASFFSSLLPPPRCYFLIPLHSLSFSNFYFRFVLPFLLQFHLSLLNFSFISFIFPFFFIFSSSVSSFLLLTSFLSFCSFFHFVSFVLFFIGLGERERGRESQNQSNKSSTVKLLILTHTFNLFSISFYLLIAWKSTNWS